MGGGNRIMDGKMKTRREERRGGQGRERRGRRGETILGKMKRRQGLREEWCQKRVDNAEEKTLREPDRSNRILSGATF